jgi:hypothetical protein
MFNPREKSFLLAIGWTTLLLLSHDSSAVIINSATGTEDTCAPTGGNYSSFQYWNNVGALGCGSGTYLGNGWVLTAEHVIAVGIPSITLNGQSYNAIPNSAIRLGGGRADMAIYQLAQNPGLPSIPIVGYQNYMPDSATVLMIGNGCDRQAGLTYWDSNGNVTTAPGVYSGYCWSGTRSMRWGTNVVTGDNIPVPDAYGINTSFVTTFDAKGPAAECQAAAGDSGGGVFYYDGTKWELAGMMFAIGTNYSAAIFGDQTYSASLANYRNLVPIPGDINGDGLVDVADYDVWAANVGKTGAAWCQGDLNGDGLVDVADYDIWAANVGNTASTPEPATMAMLAIGGIGALLRRLTHPILAPF